MPYSYTIIDNDAVSALQLKTLLQEYGDFVCADHATNTSEGLNAILKYTPDLVLMQLGTQEDNCFRMVADIHQYLEELPAMIGISHTTDYAYKAIKHNFFDYWLQPYNEFDIRKCLTKLKRRLPEKNGLDTICLKSYKDYQYLDTEDILYLKADNNTTEFIMKDGSVTHAYKTLKTFEDRLPAHFMRIHQSYIVNTHYITRINFGKSICGLKCSDKTLPFSKTYKERLDHLKTSLSKNTLSGLN